MRTSVCAAANPAHIISAAATAPPRANIDKHFIEALLKTKFHIAGTTLSNFKEERGTATFCNAA
jgi:hypothetical protein